MYLQPNFRQIIRLINGHSNNYNIYNNTNKNNKSTSNSGGYTISRSGMSINPNNNSNKAS
jgi:hypothetical protein